MVQIFRNFTNMQVIDTKINTKQYKMLEEIKYREDVNSKF